MSNKNLAAIEGSLERAHKECNKFYYDSGKGSDCTPEVSGTFRCWDDSNACRSVGEDCACAATVAAGSTNTTKYRIELDRDAVVEDYPTDNFCAKTNSTTRGVRPSFAQYSRGGSRRTFINVIAPTGGWMVWAQSHLHTGGINATLYKIREAICTNEAAYGSNLDPTSNARDEQNHLVRISSCYEQIGDRIRFEAGDVFDTKSYYYGRMDDDRFSSMLAAREHKNVMSMFFTGVVLDGDFKFLAEERPSFGLWNDFVNMAGT